jgi:hypothetical protein
MESWYRPGIEAYLRFLNWTEVDVDVPRKEQRNVGCEMMCSEAIILGSLALNTVEASCDLVFAYLREQLMSSLLPMACWNSRNPHVWRDVGDVGLGINRGFSHRSNAIATITRD